MKGYIYVRTHKSYELHNAIKTIEKLLYYEFKFFC